MPEMVLISSQKSEDEDMRSGKLPRERADLVQGLCNTAAYDTTSELHVRKCHAGCAR